MDSWLDIKNVDADIKLAYDSGLSKKEQRLLLQRLVFIRSKSSDPCNYLDRLVESILVVEERLSRAPSAKDWLAKPLLVALLTAVVTVPATFYLTKTLNNYFPSQQECPPAERK